MFHPNDPHDELITTYPLLKESTAPKDSPAVLSPRQPIWRVIIVVSIISMLSGGALLLTNRTIPTTAPVKVAALPTATIAAATAIAVNTPAVAPTVPLGKGGVVVAAAPLTGWQAAGSDLMQSVTFSNQQDPATGYNCVKIHHPADTADHFTPNSFEIGTTHDGGSSWSYKKYNYLGTRCIISRDPLDGQSAVLLISSLLSLQDAAKPYLLYRTYDGGQQWEEMPGTYTNLGLTWDTQHTVFLSNTLSIDGNGITYILPHQPPQSLPAVPQGSFHGSLASGKRFYEQSFTFPANVARSQAAYTEDYGKTWTTLVLDYHGWPIVITGSDAKRNALYAGALISDGPVPPGAQTNLLLQSLDGGSSWSELPTIPNAEYIAHWLSQPAPLSDGATLYVPWHSLRNSGKQAELTLYRLRLGNSTWEDIGPIAVNQIANLSFDSNGHAALIWGHVVSNGYIGPLDGMLIHQP